MIAPTLTQILIIACGFGIVGLYVWIVHLVVKSSESDSSTNSRSKSSH